MPGQRRYLARRMPAQNNIPRRRPMPPPSPPAPADIPAVTPADRQIPAARAWWLAARPHTLSLSAAPALAGCALAWAQGAPARPWLAALTVLAALLIQIGVNLLNDAGDFERGADGPDRLGPPRASAQGWLPAARVRRAGLAALACALALGLPLAWAGGWPIALMGLAALACAWGYTAGPHPISCGPWGEAFVCAFFGLAAVAGSHWLQAHAYSPAAWWLGLMLGALAAAVMLINNTRDAASDTRAGRRTLAARLGPRRSRALLAALLAAPYALWPAFTHALAAPPQAWPLLTLPWAAWLLWRAARLPASRALNPLLGQIAALQAAFVALLALGALG